MMDEWTDAKKGEITYRSKDLHTSYTVQLADLLVGIA
jgi:hypothetical protein